MTTWFAGKSTRQTQPTPPASALRIQTAVAGRPLALGWGQGRLAGNLIGYWDFRSIAVQQDQGQGGKGGAGGGGKGGQGNVTYTYQAAVAIGLCEGPVSGVGQAWYNQSKTANIGAALNLVLFSGSYAQTSWGYLASLHPGDAFNYRGLAYVAAGPMQLGNNPQLPNISFEIQFTPFGAAVGGSPDALPGVVDVDFLTNVHYGVGFPADLIGDRGVYNNYCLAAGMLVSPVLTEQQAASRFLADLMTATNSEYVWSAGQLKVVPYGDAAISGNGGIYTPPSAPLYSLGDDDFRRANNSDDAPIVVTRKRVAEQGNTISIEYLDRTSDYNPAVVEVKDDAAIQAYGLRKKDLKTLHFFCFANAAHMSAALMLGREKVVRTFSFVLGPEYILLDPMDIVAVNDAALGLVDQWVRIREIQENDDLTLSITAEEYLAGTGAAPLYGRQASTGALPNYQVDPGPINPPVMFELPDQLAGGLAVSLAISGQNKALWGGCDIYASYDGLTYQKLGRQLGPSRMGVVTAPLFVVPASPTPPTIDSLQSLAVDLSRSGSQLLSGSLQDMASGNTSIWLGSGEIVGYQSAVLTGPNAYSLTPLNRGMYGSPIAAASAGTAAIRLDQGVFQMSYTQDRIGTVVYFKFVSFNAYQGGIQSLAAATPYTYKFAGTALASPLPSVTSFTSVFHSNITQLSWTEVTDFRQPILYEIRKGTDWTSGAVIGRYAHPPVPALGDGTYWINSYCQPISGLQVYGATPISQTLSGSVIPLNVKASWDEAATGWTGILDGSVFFDGLFVRTVGAGDILAALDVFALLDVIDYQDGPGSGGTYEVPVSHAIDVGYVAACLVSITFAASGVPVEQNVFEYDPFFSVTDFFGAFANQFVSVYPQVALSQDGVTWGPWQNYQAGYYRARKYKARMVVQTNDPNTIAFLTAFEFTVYVPTRVDHSALIGGVVTSLTNLAVPPAGLNLVFLPDGASSAGPFNGGVSNATRPNFFMNILSAQPGDVISITSMTLSGCTVQVTNAGVGVARNVNCYPEGY
jgi:hypothetical protein